MIDGLFLENAGLSITYRPPIVSGTGEGGTLTGDFSSLSMTKDAAGGFYSLGIGLKMDQADAEEWTMLGLGRDMTVKDEGGDVAWNGFLNSARASLGSVTFRRGPLTGVVNRCYGLYSERDTTVNPPAITPGQLTLLAQDAPSQAKYGIWEDMLNCGECTAVEAQQARDGHIARYKEPETSGDFTLGSGTVDLTLDCLGYRAWLQAYPYQDLVGATVTIQTKMQAVLAADPNGVISTDYSHIGANATLAGRYENSGTPAWDVAKALTMARDAAGNRWTFGIYADRVAWYEQPAMTVTYRHAIADMAQKITSAAGEIQPWAVRPGRWMMFVNLLSGRTVPTTDLSEDPRALFVERVQYDAPDRLTITGTRRDNKAQVIANTGFGGLGG